MEVILEPYGEEIDDVTEQIKKIIVNEPPKTIKNEKGIINFYIKDFDKHFCIFEKLYDENNHETIYVFVFKGYFLHEGGLTEDLVPKNNGPYKIGGINVSKDQYMEWMLNKEVSVIKDQLIEILKKHPPEVLKGEKGHINMGDPVDIIITEKTIYKSDPNRSKYSFIIPGYYTLI